MSISTKTVKPGSARKAKIKTVKVKVIVDMFGTYPKGKVLDMHKSTALACIENEVVEKVGKW